MTENKGRGHITLRNEGIKQRIDFRFSERPDGRYDLTIGAEHEVVDSIETVIRRLGRIKP